MLATDYTQSRGGVFAISLHPLSLSHSLPSLSLLPSTILYFTRSFSFTYLFLFLSYTSFNSLPLISSLICSYSYHIPRARELFSSHRDVYTCDNCPSFLLHLDINNPTRSLKYTLFHPGLTAQTRSRYLNEITTAFGQESECFGRRSNLAAAQRIGAPPAFVIIGTRMTSI